MWIGALCALLLTGCAAESGRVASLTSQFVEKAKTPDAKLRDFYAPEAVLSVDKALGFGGDFKGPEGVDLFFERMRQTLVEKTPQIHIIGVDESRGTALLKMDVDAQMIQTGKSFRTSILHVLEWNQVSGKIITHMALDMNPSQTIGAYQTDAEKYFEKLLWTLYRSSYEQLIDTNSSLWKLMSDDISVKVNVYPEDLFSKLEWNGKTEVMKGFKEMGDLHRNLPLYKQLLTRTNLVDAKVLLSTNTEVWVRWGYKHEDGHVVTHAVVHYTFDQNGKLVREEITFAHAARPWKIYPFPAPKQPEIDAKEVRKLMEIRSKVGQEQPLSYTAGEQQSRPYAVDQSVIEPVGQVFSGVEQKPYAKDQKTDFTKVKQTLLFSDLPRNTQDVKPTFGEVPLSTQKFGEQKTEDEEGNDDTKEDLPSDDKPDLPKDKTSKLGEIELESPIILLVDGDVHTRLQRDRQSTLETQTRMIPPMDVEVHGDMKTSIVTFGSGKVGKVKFIGSIDELEIEKPRIRLSKPASGKKNP